MKRIKHRFLRASALIMMAASLSGCELVFNVAGNQPQEEKQKEDEDKTLTITLSAPEGVSEVQRHEKIQLTPTVENGNIADLTYHIVGSATVSTSGLVTISDDAVVGSTVGVYAKIGDVLSNVVEFTVGQTLPEAMTLQADKSAIKNGEIVVFSAGFLPVYATAKSFVISVTDGEDLVEVCEDNPHAIQLKTGIDANEHTSETVEITARSAFKETVYASLTLQVGDPSAVKVTIAAEGDVTQLERHESVQINSTLVNAQTPDVSYVALGACTVSTTGLLTVNDDAVVGNTVGVYAVAKGAQSNILQFTVQNTAPTAMVVNPTKSILLNGDSVEFVATFEPSYATLKGYTLEVTGGSNLAQVSASNLHAVELKDGIDAADYDGQVVTVTATATGNTELTSSVNLTVSQYSGDEVLIHIEAQNGETQLERHDSVTIVPTLTNAEESDVTYHVSGPATVTSAGVVTVSDTADVGGTVSVYAIAKGVVSNTVNFTVVDTEASEIQLTANKTSLKTGETVSFSAEFVPSYTTITDFELSIVEGDDIAEICLGDLHSIQLKNGLNDLDYLDRTITVEATAASSGVKDQVVINVGLESASLNVHPVVVLVGRDNTDNLLLNVDVYDENAHLINVENSKFEFTSSNEAVVEVEDGTGRLIPHGHGTATISVSFEEFDTKTADITILVPPTQITLSDTYNNTILKHGLHTGRGAANKIVSPFESERTGDDLTYSGAIDYTFKLYDKFDDVVDIPSSSIATVSDGKITFSESITGKVVCTATSNSTIGSEKATGYEVSEDMIFNVNTGKNVETQGQAYFALRRPEVTGVNFMNNIDLDKVEAEVVEGEGTYKSYDLQWGSTDHEFYKGFRSRGDKVIQGNGRCISLAKLPIARNEGNLDASAYEGPGVFEFYPAEFDDSIFNGTNPTEVTDDIECSPFHVEMYDLSIVGNVNVQGEYQGDLDVSGVDMTAKRFVRTYRHALNVGYKNNPAGFTTLVGGVSTRNYQACANAYVDAPIFKNISIQGFDTGATFLHAVNGYVENLNVRDCYEHGVETNQCIMEFHNTTFGQVGGFGIEIAPHGVDTTDSNNFKWCLAGKNYDQKSRILMTGTITSENLNNGEDTPHMSTYSVTSETPGGQVTYTISMVIQGVVQDLFAECFTELYLTGDTDYQALISNPLTGDLSQKGLVAAGYAQQILGETLFNEGFGTRINFLSFVFLLEYTAYYSIDITGDDVAEVTANVSGGSTNLITLKDLIKNALMASAKNTTYTDYVNYAYIKVDVDGPTLQQVAHGYVGQVLTVNNAYAG